VTDGEPTDAELVGRSRADPEQFGVIFERHAAAVYAFVSRRAGREIADDLLGDLFATAFAARTRFDARFGTALPWLLGIARNLLGAQARRSRRQAAALARIPAEPDADGWRDVDARLDAEARADGALPIPL
jgi:DNA-directed RNA polymerase specialized sigma24 family protein